MPKMTRRNAELDITNWQRSALSFYAIVGLNTRNAVGLIQRLRDSLHTNRTAAKVQQPQMTQQIGE